MAALIGMSPSRVGSPALTPTGGRSSSADRLRSFLGLSVDEYLQKFPQRYNLLERPPWNVKRARPRGLELRYSLSGIVYVLGLGPWKAMGFPERKFFTLYRTRWASWILIPHPSGKNSLYNNPGTRKRLRRTVANERRYQL